MQTGCTATPGMNAPSKTQHTLCIASCTTTMDNKISLRKYRQHHA